MDQEKNGKTNICCLYPVPGPVTDCGIRPAGIQYGYRAGTGSPGWPGYRRDTADTVDRFLNIYRIQGTGYRKQDTGYRIQE